MSRSPPTNPVFGFLLRIEAGLKKEAEVGSNRGRSFEQLKLSEVQAEL